MDVESVAIVEWESLSPVGPTAEEAWAELTADRSGVGWIDRFEPGERSWRGVEQVPYAAQVPFSYADLAGSAVRFRKWSEPAHHGVRSVVDAVLEKLDFDVSEHCPQRIALLGGTALTAQISQDKLYQRQTADPRFILSQCHNMPLASAAKAHGLKGPSFSISGACASSGHALLVARQFIQTGMVDFAVVVGFEFPVLEVAVGGFKWIKTLYQRDEPSDRAFDDPTKASRPFARDRRGFVLGEAVAAILVSHIDYAKRMGWPIRGLIRGGYCNSDAHHVTRVSTENIATCMRGALENARCSVDEVDCVNAHATSTRVGDLGELTALHQVFGDRLTEIPLVANKSQLGHSLGASTVLSVSLAARGMNEGVLLPTLNHIPDPALPEAYIPRETADYDHDCTLLNSFGFGGTNVCMVLERGGQPA